MKKFLFIGCQGASLHHEMPAYFLSKNGFEVHYIGDRSVLEIEKIMGISEKLYKIESKVVSSNKIIRILKIFYKILSERVKGYDLLYLYSPHNIYTSFFSQFNFRRPVIYHTQDFIEPSKYKLRVQMERYLMRRADLVVVNDPNRAMFFKTYYNLKQLPLVVRTALPRDFPFGQFDVEKRKKYLIKSGISVNSEYAKVCLHIGPYSHKRCSDTLLQSFNILPENYILLFTGYEPGSSSYYILLDLIKKYSLNGRVGILPRLSYSELFDLIAQVDVGFLLYPDDDLGNFYQTPGRLTEYIGSGVSVIASNFPSLEITIKRYNLGEVCNPYDSNSIAENIIKVSNITLSDREKLKETFKKYLAYEIDGIKLLNSIENLLS